MQNPSEARERRSQRDYSLPFKLAVVGEVGHGELSYKLMLRSVLLARVCDALPPGFEPRARGRKTCGRARQRP